MSRKFFDIRKAESTEVSIPILNSIPKAGFLSRFNKKKLLKIGFYASGIILGTGFVALVARASLEQWYPAECAGSWDNPALASGMKDTALEQGLVFDGSNSAVMSGGNGREIVCSGFSGEKGAGKLLKVKLNLAWNFRKDVPLPAISEVVASTTDTSSAPESATTTASNEATTASSTPEAPALEATTSAEGQGPSTTTPPAPEPIVPATAPSTESASEPVAPSPANETQPSAFLRLFTPVAWAEDGPVVTASLAFDGLEHFLDIEYSTDGSSWKSVGNENLELDLASWEELAKLQIRIKTLREGRDLPKIYLHGMWLEIRYVPSEAPAGEASSTVSAEDVQATDASTSDPTLADTLTEAAANALDAIANVFTPDTTSPEIHNFIAEISAPTPPEIGFFASEDAGQASLTEAFTKLLPKDQKKPDMIIAPDSKSITISGFCADKYATVMIFADPNDLSIDPAKAILNRAVPCAEGKYSFNLENSFVPISLPDGDYYLVLGEQKEGESAVPNSVPFKIKIKRI